MLDDLATSLQPRRELRTRLLAALAAPPGPVRDTWGTDTAAAQGQRAMIALAGAPAAPRRRPRR